MTPAPSTGDRDGRRDPYAPFRPRRGRVVALVCAVAFVLAFGYLAVVIPAEGTFGWGLWDRVVLVLFALVVAGGLYRYAALRAIPSAAGLRVVNLVQRHDLEWAQIASVGFSGGMPWVVLELTDTEEVAVMAIQRADGDFGRAEAGRLSALVAHHTGAADE